MNQNYLSDFVIRETHKDGIDPAVPFRFLYSTWPDHVYEASYDGAAYKNCKLMPDGTLMVFFENHGLAPGHLYVLREYKVPDTDFTDGVRNEISKDYTNIILTDGRSDSHIVNLDVIPAYKEGKKGDKMTFADLTPAEIAALKQPATDAAQAANTAANNANTAAAQATTAATSANEAAANANGFMKYVTEYNVSELYPTSGVGGTNKYTLAGAIEKLNADPKVKKTIGIKCSFLDNADGQVKIYVYQGDIFESVNSWVSISSVAEKYITYKGDIIDTHELQTIKSYRKIYFNKEYVAGSIITDMTTPNGVNSFYLVKKDNTLDTSLLINKSKLPYTIPNESIGLASSVDGNLTITIKYQGLKNRIEDNKKDINNIHESLYRIENDGVWKGKTIVLFGDSIMHMIDMNGKSISQYIAEKTKAHVIKCAIGGATIRQRDTPTLSPIAEDKAYANLDIINMVKALATGDKSYIQAAKKFAIEHPEATTINAQMDSIDNILSLDINTVDAVFIAGGTNDFRNVGSNLIDETKGSMSHTGEAMKEILRLLSTCQKYIPVYVFTPIVRFVDPYYFDEWKDYKVKEQVEYNGQRYRFILEHPQGPWKGTDVEEITAYQMRDEVSWGDGFINTGGINLKEFCKRLTFLCEDYNVPVCDMYNTMGWNIYNFSQVLINTDGTHPLKGLKYMAEKMVSYVLSNQTF